MDTEVYYKDEFSRWWKRSVCRQWQDIDSTSAEQEDVERIRQQYTWQKQIHDDCQSVEDWVSLLYAGLQTKITDEIERTSNQYQGLNNFSMEQDTNIKFYRIYTGLDRSKLCKRELPQETIKSVDVMHDILSTKNRKNRNIKIMIGCHRIRQPIL